MYGYKTHEKRGFLVVSGIVDFGDNPGKESKPHKAYCIGHGAPSISDGICEGVHRSLLILSYNRPFLSLLLLPVIMFFFI